MERIEELKLKYPKFYYNGHKSINLESIELLNIDFKIGKQINTCDLEINNLIEQLKNLKESLPQCDSILCYAQDEYLMFNGIRIETEEEFEKRKEKIKEENELFLLMTEEEKEKRKRYDYQHYLQLHKQFNGT